MPRLPVALAALALLALAPSFEAGIGGFREASRPYTALEAADAHPCVEDDGTPYLTSSGRACLAVLPQESFADLVLDDFSDLAVPGAYTLFSGAAAVGSGTFCGGVTLSFDPGSVTAVDVAPALPDYLDLEASCTALPTLGYVRALFG